MASVRVNMRIPGDVWAAVSAYARRRESNNTAVVVAALRGFLDDAGGGVPDLPSVERVERPVPGVSQDPRLVQMPKREWFNSYEGWQRALSSYKRRGKW